MEGHVRAIILAGGQTHKDENGRRWVQEGDLIVGADGGAARALAWGLVPHLVVGDMDSLSAKDQTALVVQGCRFVVHPRAKDETDLELALTYAVQQGAREIVVFGALGGRLDHTLANVLLLTLPALEGISVRFVLGPSEAFLVRGGEVATVEGQPGDLVSLLPLRGDAGGVRTAGLAWALHGDDLHFGFTRGVSNEMTAPVAEIGLDRGHLLVVHSPPPEG
jgi:thiamine pyrophosphokinase